MDFGRELKIRVVRIALFILALFVGLNLSDAASQAIRQVGARGELADQANDFVRFHAVGLTKRTIRVELLQPRAGVTCDRYLSAFRAENAAKRAELRSHGFMAVACGSRVEVIR